MDENIQWLDSGYELEECFSSLLPVPEIAKDHAETTSTLNDDQDSDSDDEPYVAPPELVQITASKAEVVQMINSFIAGKRAKVNQQNIREFCGPDYDGLSCARVSAVKFTKRLVQVEDAEKYWGKFKKK